MMMSGQLGKDLIVQSLKRALALKVPCALQYISYLLGRLKVHSVYFHDNLGLEYFLSPDKVGGI